MTNDFYNKVAEEKKQINTQLYQKEKREQWITGKKSKPILDFLIYKGLVDLPQIDYYFQGDFCVCPIVRQAMTPKRFKKLGQYLQLGEEEERPDWQSADFDILYEARPALDLIDEFTQAYIPGCELAVDEVMIGFKGRFFLKQYLPGKPTKWGI